MLWLYLDKYRPAKFFIFIYFFKFYILNKSKKEQKHHSVFFIYCVNSFKVSWKKGSTNHQISASSQTVSPIRFWSSSVNHPLIKRYYSQRQGCSFHKN